LSYSLCIVFNIEKKAQTTPPSEPVFFIFILLVFCATHTQKRIKYYNKKKINDKIQINDSNKKKKKKKKALCQVVAFFFFFFVNQPHIHNGALQFQVTTKA
jgi:hypothetical protein